MYIIYHKARECRKDLMMNMRISLYCDLYLINNIYYSPMGKDNKETKKKYAKILSTLKQLKKKIFKTKANKLKSKARQINQLIRTKSQTL